MQISGEGDEDGLPVLKELKLTCEIRNFGHLHFDTVAYDFLYSTLQGFIINYDSITLVQSEIRIGSVTNYGSIGIKSFGRLRTAFVNFGNVSKTSTPLPFSAFFNVDGGPFVNYGLLDSLNKVSIQGSFSNFGAIKSELLLRNGFTRSTYMQSSGGNITLDISGKLNHQYENVEFENIGLSLVDFDGSVILNLVDYTPLVGDSFNIIQWDNTIPVLDSSSSSVMFDLSNLSYTFPDLDSCKSWEIKQTFDPFSFGSPNPQITVVVVSSPDTDQDGTLDCDDLCPNDSLKIDPGICGCGVPDLDSDGDGQPDCLDTDVTFSRQSSSSIEGIRLSGLDADSAQLWYLGSVTDTDTSLMLMNRRKEAVQFGTHNTLQMTLDAEGRLGIGKTPSQYRLEVNGQASKSSPGDWLANSDARLKHDIKPIDGASTLSKLLSLQGVTYQWNDDAQYDRPGGIQYGLTAQNVQDVFPELVQEDIDGKLMTSYGTLDPMFIAANRALYNQIGNLKSIVELLKSRLLDFERNFATLLRAQTQNKYK
jgi:hypothetical protein